MTLDQADIDLVEAARAVLLKHYRPHWHTVGAALRSRDGRIWTGVHLGATVGRLAIARRETARARGSFRRGRGEMRTWGSEDHTDGGRFKHWVRMWCDSLGQGWAG